MLRYLQDLRVRPRTNRTRWWEIFPGGVREFLFMFVSGRFGGDFRGQLRALSESAHGAPGAAVSACVLLIIAEKRDGRDEMLREMRRRPLRLPYRLLVGSAFTPRGAARCNGIIQAAVPGQKRRFISDWPADNFIRWAHALGFVSWDEKDDRFQATESGDRLSRARAGSEEEHRIFADAMLSYPPAVRVLDILAESESGGESAGVTKFDIGRWLGFQGEKGFTTVSQNFLVREFCLAPPDKAKRIRSNWEGSADKYARMICAWLAQLRRPWVRRERREFFPDAVGARRGCLLSVYFLTADGFEERKKSGGRSSSRKVSKHLPATMLCPNAPGRSLLRRCRARIVKAILQRGLSVAEIGEILSGEGFVRPRSAVEADLAGLKNIGLSIERAEDGRFRCRDRIHGLEIPRAAEAAAAEDEIRVMIEDCGSKLRLVPRDFLALIEMAFDRRQSALFEVKIAELLTEVCGFMGGHLGGAHRPDGAFYHGDWGVIVDAKSYAGGFNIPAGERDKMLRYLQDLRVRPRTNRTRWWEIFPGGVREFLFMFVSGKFGGDFRGQLRALSESAHGALGAAVSAYVLLIMAEKIARGEMSHGEFKRRISGLDGVDLSGREQPAPRAGRE